MPSGDAQRTWFPEIVDALRHRWRDALPMAEVVELRDNLDAMLRQIRSDRHIQPPVIKCPRCGRLGPAAEPHVTVRAMILALGRFGIVPIEQVKILENRWAAHRKEKQLDLYGQAAGPVRTTAVGCDYSGA